MMLHNDLPGAPIWTNSSIGGPKILNGMNILNHQYISVNHTYMIIYFFSSISQASIKTEQSVVSNVIVLVTMPKYVERHLEGATNAIGWVIWLGNAMKNKNG